MKKVILFILTVSAVSINLSAQENWLSYTLNAQVLTEDGKEFSYAVTDWCEENGGYFTYMSPEVVNLRFPWDKIDMFRDWLTENTRDIYSIDQSSQDLRRDILNLRSGIEARSEVLNRNIEYLDKSDFEGTLTLEQEIRRLMTEIDTRKGSLRKLENDRSMVYASLSISFLTNSLPERGSSSFEWINSMDFYSFMKGYKPDTILKKVSFELPDGFAQAEEGKIWGAVSPEGIRIRLRWVENYPEMTPEFWKEALSADLKNRGYLPLGDIDTIETESGKTAILMNWGVPFGQDDYIYTSVFKVEGKKILILETAGPVLMMDDYKETIVDKIKQSF
jgi:hypothetical protein